MKSCSIGGQGVLEGVMMRSIEESALAVRKENGKIVTKKWKNKKRDNKFFKLPVVRGCVSFIDMLFQGTGVITDSAKMYDENMTEEPSKLDKAIAKKTGKSENEVMMVFAVIIALVLAVGLFFLLPSFLVGLFSKHIESPVVVSLCEGLIRIIIFIGYMIFCTCVKDVKRVFMYHGSEHKTIACYENELPLTVENVRPQRRLHPRCGTSYLLLVMIISIVIYSFITALFRAIGLDLINNSTILRTLSRLILLPIIAGVSYEVLKGCAKHENWFTKIIRWPGMQLQRLTTKEPDDSMIEVAIVAFEMALGEKSDEEIAELIASFDRSEKKKEAEENEGAEEKAEAEETEKPEQTAEAEAEEATE